MYSTKVPALIRRTPIAKAFAVVLLAGSLGACVGFGPEATTGAIVGGTAGAAVGNLATGTTEGTLVGAAIGAGTGAAVGGAVARDRSTVRCGFDPRYGREVCFYR